MNTETFSSTTVTEEGYVLRFPSRGYANLFPRRDGQGFVVTEVEVQDARIFSAARVYPAIEPEIDRHCRSHGYTSFEMVRVVRTVTTAVTESASAPTTQQISP